MLAVAIIAWHENGDAADTLFAAQEDFFRASTVRFCKQHIRHIQALAGNLPIHSRSWLPGPDVARWFNIIGYVERGQDGWRGYFEWVPRGRFTVEYAVRLNAVGRFQLPPTRVQAMYSPEIRGALPNRLVWQVESPDELPEGHAVKTKALKDGAPTVYITQRGLVSEPFTSPVALSQFLTLPTQPVQAEPRQAVH